MDVSGTCWSEGQRWENQTLRMEPIVFQQEMGMVKYVSTPKAFRGIWVSGFWHAPMQTASPQILRSHCSLLSILRVLWGFLKTKNAVLATLCVPQRGFETPFFVPVFTLAIGRYRRKHCSEGCQADPEEESA